jgi:hypothetical protein
MGFLNKLSKNSSKEYSFYPSKVDKCVGTFQCLWAAFGMSKNGIVQAAISVSGLNDTAPWTNTLWISKDTGVSWERNSAWSTLIGTSGPATLSSIDLSLDGKVIIATTANKAYYSHNTGNTWTLGYTYITNDSLRSSAVSSDGKVMVILPGGYIDAPNQLYVSVNSGVNWTTKTHTVGSWTASWRNIEMSDDGAIMAAHGNNSAIRVSSDTGNTWTGMFLFCSTTPQLSSVAMSSNGMCIRMSDLDSSRIYNSSNSGARNQWIGDPRFLEIYGVSDISMSSSARAQVVGTYRDPVSLTNGHCVFYSPNYGMSWFNYSGCQKNNPFFNNVKISADGKTITAIPESGYIMTNAPMWLQKGQNNTGDSANRFGFSVSINCQGNIIAGSSTLYGYVQIKCYSSFQNSWFQFGSSCITGTCCYGKNIQLSENGCRIIIGAPAFISSQSSSNVVSCAETYCYNSSFSRWEQYGDKITAGATFSGGMFYPHLAGYSVSMNSSGNIIAVGYPGFTNNGSGRIGLTRLFCYDQNQNIWNQLGQDLYGQGNSYYFGWCVSLNGSGNIVAVGAPGGSITVSGQTYSNNGKVIVYSYNSGINSWQQIGQNITFLQSNSTCGGSATDFAMSLNLNKNGNTLVVGYPLADRVLNSDFNWGNATIYSYDSGLNNWLQKGQALSGEKNGDEFGYSVSINSDGSIVAIGADENCSTGLACAGSIKVYSYSELANTWQKVGQDIDGCAVGEYVGNSVQLNSIGNELVTSAYMRTVNGSRRGDVFSLQWKP